MLKRSKVAGRERLSVRRRAERFGDELARIIHKGFCRSLDVVGVGVMGEVLDIEVLGRAERPLPPNVAMATLEPAPPECRPRVIRNCSRPAIVQGPGG
jgi:hypothetical protein